MWLTIHKCLWACWYNSIFRSAYCYTTNVIVILVASQAFLHLPKCFDRLPTLLAYFFRCLLLLPSYRGSYHTPTSALCSATGFPSRCIQLQTPLRNHQFKKHFLQLFWTFRFSFLKLASVSIVVLCWWLKAIALPVTEAVASAGKHGRQDGLEDLKVSLIRRIKFLSCE